MSTVRLTNNEIDQNVQVAGTNVEGHPIFPSEGGQDYWLWWHYFRFLNRPITYADFGSNDPLVTSNSFFLDRCLQATGVCVDGM